MFCGENAMWKCLLNVYLILNVNITYNLHDYIQFPKIYKSELNLAVPVTRIFLGAVGVCASCTFYLQVHVWFWDMCALRFSGKVINIGYHCSAKTSNPQTDMFRNWFFISCYIHLAELGLTALGSNVPSGKCYVKVSVECVLNTEC